MNFFQRFLPQRFLSALRGLIHLDEPLLRRTENHRIVAAPAMRIAVLIVVIGKQRAAILKQLHDDGIRSENVLAFVLGQAFEKDAFVINRCVCFQAVFLPGEKIVRAVARSRVHDPRPLIELDVIG